MLRAAFFSVGLFVTLWGASFLYVDKLVLKQVGDATQDQGFRGIFTSRNEQREKIFAPPDWTAFSLMSVGTVTMLYAILVILSRSLNAPVDILPKGYVPG